MPQSNLSDLHTSSSSDQGKSQLQFPLQFIEVTLQGIAEIPQAQQAAYRRSGYQGTPVVLLHGFLGDSANWQGVMAEISQMVALDNGLDNGSAIDLIALDLLGFGASSKPPVAYTVAQEVAFLRAVLQQLGLESCILVGHSFGGWVSAAYTIAYPDQVSALCLVAPAGIRDDSFCGRYNWMRPVLWQTPVVDALLWCLKPVAMLFRQTKTLELICWARRELNRQPAARSFLVDRLRPEDAIDTVEEYISVIITPTLILAAEVDDTIPAWHCETYAELITGAELMVIPEAGHGLPQNNPTAIAHSLIKFIHRLRSGFPSEPA
ncbi:MAG: alpha/beta hydrolase [Alkalinema sp. CAN_BIN05]|nr:alpha/beta hydrolase [Alkalinema sp. CAN_BIN05]